MSFMTLEEKKDLHAKYLKALCAVLKNKEYTIGSRTYVRVDEPKLRKGLAQLNQAICAASGQGTIRARRVVFRDG